MRQTNQIFKTVLRIPSEPGQHKALSTCLPHLLVTSLLLCTGIFAYLKPTSSSTSGLDLMVTVLDSVVPPASTATVIYSMRNMEIKGQNLWVFISKLTSTVCHFLTNLSLLDVLLTSMVIPMVSNQETSSFPSYHAQAYFHFLMDCMEFFLFHIMSFDFQMAISYLLQYLTIVQSDLPLAGGCLMATGGSATITPAVLFDSFNGDGGNTEAGFGDEEDDVDEVVDSSQQASRETGFPDSQELFLTLDLEPVPPETTQGCLPDLPGGDGTSGECTF
ncbi:unnamed protein product [Caretta caretta]